jgi:hypothetical protein
MRKLTSLQKWEGIFWHGARGMFLAMLSAAFAAKPLSLIVACIIIIGCAFEMAVAGFTLLFIDKEEGVKELHLYAPDEVISQAD